MSFRSIRNAQSAVWPTVKDSLRRVRASRALVAKDPSKASKSALQRARIPWDRVVANETVWAIARADLLATQAQAEVIHAARLWAKSWDPEPPAVGRDDPEDVDLYAAVQALALDVAPNDGDL